MKNRAFKMWLYNASEDGFIDKMVLLIVKGLARQEPMMFDLMEEANTEYTIEGFKKAAQFVIDQVNNDPHKPV